MTQEEIIQGNRIIVQFTGDAITDDGKEWVNSNKRLVGEYKYHSDWNWLMPVVLKILSTYNSACILGSPGYSSSYPESGWQFSMLDDYIRPFQNKNENPIQAVWLAVVDFCKWYLQKQSNNQL